MTFKVEHFSIEQILKIYFLLFILILQNRKKEDLKDGVTKLSFHYELSANPNADYNIYALVLHERIAEIEQKGGKLLLRA